MGFWGELAIFAVVALILRALRAHYIWVDYVAYALGCILLGGSIYIWVSDSFWGALLTFILGSIVLYLLFGIGSTTDIERFGRTYSLECSECGYGGLEIVADNYDTVTTKCKRCGAVYDCTLNH